ncbi:hypothetical protein F5B22DRAFT_366077 [Xylaria bambusicola]|uniref:uncharacterized protein n=1 Tax=Xylaria bambusicola TaxID=326684 RepID=UPI0020081788|nr:uncharacterized protein F5B22DRAFT_366077 [Xylaria bambusicola]KAI0509207.1 hypothetical protein F5B22DRAFT_366077 [Xylaria bambusicola]
MKTSLILSIFATIVHAAFLSATNSTTITTTTTSSTSYSSTPTPTPTSYAMHCGGSIADLCGDVCFCSSRDMNCHADPSARCYQMCRCVPEIPQQGKIRGIQGRSNR